MARHAGTVLAMLFLVHAAAAQFIQQGDKLVGTAGYVKLPEQGYSVAISADGNTAVVGSYDAGAWVFTRSSGVWTQQGNNLFGTGAFVGTAQGYSVGLSADGNTAIVGDPYDGWRAGAGAAYGAAWVFTRSGGVWSQQGAKLVGTGAVGAAQQGYSVAISADGKTAIVGGKLDDANAGAVWAFTRSGGTWTQQGTKLVGSGTIGVAYQGCSVAISADGNTAVVGGYLDNSGIGAVWAFTRSGGTWTQQGTKLVGTGAVGLAYQGSSVAISADGNTAIVGGVFAHAAWVYTRSGGVWLQQGSKLAGQSVAISADGNTAIVGGGGGYFDVGGARVYTRSEGMWSQQGSDLVGTGAVGDAGQGCSVAISADGNTAIVGGDNDNSGVGAAWVFVSDGAIICVPPSILLQPLQNLGVEQGTSATLSVTVTGTAPLLYEWYQGAAGDTSRPLGGDASTFVTPPLASRASFWVRITNACGTVDSATATIGVWRGVRRHLQRAP